MSSVPFGNFTFDVQIDGVSAAGFAEVSGLSSESDVVEYREGNQPIHTKKLVGLTKYSSVTLKRGYSRDASLWEWRRNITQGQADRRTVVIRLRDEAGEPVVQFKLRNAWIAQYQGPELNAQGSGVAIETIELAHEGFDVEFA